MKNEWIIVLAVLGFAMTGCATITRGTTESYVVLSDPPGANVTLSSGETCTTPCTLEKKRNEPFTVNIAKDGYESFDLQVTNQLCDEGKAALAGNVLLVGSLVWASIDTMSGATQELSPNPCEVKLVHSGANPGG